ncbi:MAG: hypothetical protein ACC628_11935 [Pirellulaceae bacterium]
MSAKAGPDPLIHALDRIVELYVAWGKPEQVESWKAKLREEQQRRPSK